MAETCGLCNAERGPLHAHPDATVLARKLIEAVEAAFDVHDQSDDPFINGVRAGRNYACYTLRDTCKKLGVNVDG